MSFLSASCCFEVGLLRSVLLEPSFLANVAKAQVDPADTELATLVALARSDDERFRFVRKFDCELLVRCDAGKVE